MLTFIVISLIFPFNILNGVTL